MVIYSKRSSSVDQSVKRSKMKEITTTATNLNGLLLSFVEFALTTGD